MITLLPMTPEAFAIFDKLSREDFAQSKTRGEKLSMAEGIRIAESAWDTVIPHGQATPGHHFFTAWNDGLDIGMIWFKEERDWATPYAYLYQVWIWDEFQGQGLGRALMKALEAKCLEYNLARIRLHVFAFNERAHKLYRSMGFETTNVVMLKDL